MFCGGGTSGSRGGGCGNCCLLDMNIVLKDTDPEEE